MAERSLRGMSIGAKSLESDDNVDFAARMEVAYVCPRGHRTILPFAEEPTSRANGSAVAARPRIVRTTKTTPATTSPSRRARTGTCFWNAAVRTN